MKIKTLSILIALGLALSQTHQASANDGPVNLGTARAFGERGAGFVTVEPERKVKHSDAPSQIFIVFEDGSWILDADGLPNSQDGILVTWDETGCFDWGICE